MKTFIQRHGLMLLLLLIVNAVLADSFSIDGITYSINSDGKTCMVSSGKTAVGAVVIPETVSYNGKEYTVTSINKSAFELCKDLTSITMPNTVTSIGEYAFFGCKSLTNVTLSNTLTSIGHQAFQLCTGLTNITIPNSVTSIGQSAFSECRGLTSLTIPNSVISIGYGAFGGSSLGGSNYSGPIFDKVTFEDGTKELEGSGLAYSYRGTYGTMYKPVPVKEFYIGRNIKGSNYSNYLANDDSLKRVTIGNTVTYIEDGAFSSCRNLKKVVLGQNLEKIGAKAFYNAGFQNITIPKSVTSIGDGAFYSDKLKNITYEDGTEELDGTGLYLTNGSPKYSPIEILYLGRNTNGSFRSSELKKLTVGNTVNYISESAFNGCKSLSDVTLGGSLEKIENNAFQGCNLTAISLPNSLKWIGDNAFAGQATTNSQKAIAFGSNISHIGQNAFDKWKFTDLYFLGTKCPEVDDAFYGSIYLGNIAIDTEFGLTASRQDYYSGDTGVAMLHLNPNMSSEEKAKFTDLTRPYSIPDKYVGNQYKWPTVDELNKAYSTAGAGTLYDGATAYTENKSLHKFVLVSFDATEDDSQQWTFDENMADEWRTIMLPFSMTKRDVTRVFGEDTEVCKFSAVKRDVTNKTITLEFKDEQCQTDDKGNNDIVIEAYAPYMIKSIGDGTYTFRYSIEPELLKPTKIKATDGATYSFVGNRHSKSEGSDGSMENIYIPQYSYFLGDKNGQHVMYFQTGTTGVWKQWTAVVTPAKGKTDHNTFFSGSNPASLVSSFGKDGTSYVYEVNAGSTPDVDGNVYTIDGRKVSRFVDIKQLPKGLYISNGKKYVIK